MAMANPTETSYASSRTPLVWIIAVLILALIAGFVFGRWTGMTTQNNTVAKLQPLVDLAYPQPPQDMRSVTGVIENIYGATIMLQIDDPNDYLPHLDGSLRAKLTVSANTSSQTNYVSIDPTKFDKQGNATVTALKLSDLKQGNVVTVRSNQNIRNASSFDASEVQLIR